MTDKSDHLNHHGDERIADDLIKKHRTTDATVTVFDRDHTLLAHQEIVVAQRSHKFLFGCIGFDVITMANGELEGAARERAELHSEKLLELFNFITLPFYWKGFEPQRGHPDTRRLINAAQWFVDRGCLVKGHPLCWHTFAASWLLGMRDADIIQTQMARIRREVTDFAGLIDTWDVINEVVVMPIFDKYDSGITRMAQKLGRIGIIRATFEEARSANPGANLLLNDFDVSLAYEILIEGCLEAGIQIDAIGIQSHMHQGYWGVEKTLKVLERYARLGLPIHFTESTLLSGQLMPPEIVDLNDYQVKEWPTTPEGEARQAQEVVQHYKTLFSHPAVESITWWGLFDGGWLNAPSGLIRRDRSSKPAYEKLFDLIKGEWWLTPVKMATDGEGKLRFTGFLGEYTLLWAGQEAAFSLDKAGHVAVEASF